MPISNLTGILGKTFTFGTPPNESILTIDADGNWHFDGNIVVGENKIVASGTAADPEDLMNLKAVTQLLDSLYASSTEYTDTKIAEITGGTSSGNVMLSPLNVLVKDLTDGMHVPFGDLITNKFIDHVVFEMVEPFGRVDGLDFEVAIGTNTNYEEYVPFTRLSLLSGSKFNEVGKTLNKTTNIVMHIRQYIEPPPPVPPFEQVFDNLHSDVVTSKMTSDASGKIVTFTITGADLTGAISNTEAFPPDKVSGNFMDFAFNINLNAGGHYRIVEENQALSVLTGEAGIEQVDGLWRKTTEIASASGETIYPFFIGNSTGNEDYSHVYLYDLDSETPDSAIASYHIKNELNFAAVPALLSVNTPGVGNGVQIDYPSIDEGPIAFEYDTIATTRSTRVILRGSVTSLADIVRVAISEDIEMPCTYLDVLFGLEANHKYQVVIYSDVFKDIYGKDSTVQFSKGTYFYTETYEPTEKTVLSITLPINANPTAYPMIWLEDVTDGANYNVIVDSSNLEIKPPVFSSDIAEPVAMPVMLANNAVEADTGKMIVRVISF